MDKVYAIVMITGDVDATGFGVEPIGIYSSMEVAFDFVEQLEKEAPQIKGEYMFDIFEYKLDEQPLILEFFKARKKLQQQSEDYLTDMLVDLMKDGIIDQLVGEDGHFYYKLTEKGKAKGRKLKLPDHIKRLFKDKGKDEM